MYARVLHGLLTSVVLATALAVTSNPAVSQVSTPDTEGTIVIAVRHAERADDGAERAARDPALSEVGSDRARCLARTLEHAGVTRVFSTDYVRTRSTARPVAEALGLEVEGYDPRALGTFADVLRDAGGVVVVVGHSNTTPALVDALGGESVSPIDEHEYDRLYTVFLGDGGVRSTLTRYCPAG